MNFNPDPTKQAQELIFSRKVQTTNHPPLFFNENVVPQTTLQKHLGMFLDSKLNFSEHLKPIFRITNKTIGLLCKRQTSSVLWSHLGQALKFLKNRSETTIKSQVKNEFLFPCILVFDNL